MGCLKCCLPLLFYFRENFPAKLSPVVSSAADGRSSPTRGAALVPAVFGTSSSSSRVCRLSPGWSPCRGQCWSVTPITHRLPILSQQGAQPKNNQHWCSWSEQELQDKQGITASIPKAAPEPAGAVCRCCCAVTHVLARHPGPQVAFLQAPVSPAASVARVQHQGFGVSKAAQAPLKAKKGEGAG